MQLYNAQGQPLSVQDMRYILSAMSSGDENSVPRVYDSNGEPLAGGKTKNAVNQALTDAGWDEGGGAFRGQNGQYYLPLDDPNKIAQAQQLGKLQYINGVPVADFNDPSLRGGIGSGALFQDTPSGKSGLGELASAALGSVGAAYGLGQLLPALGGLGGAAGGASSAGGAATGAGEAAGTATGGGVGGGAGGAIGSGTGVWGGAIDSANALGMGSAGAGAAGGVLGASTAYDPALIDAAYSGMGATGVGSTAAGLGTGETGLLATASGLPVDAGIAGAGAASGGFSLPQLSDAASGAANGVVNPTNTPNPASLTPLARLLGLDQTGSDALSVLGPLLGAGLGAAGANAQADAYQNVANQQMAIGAPYRNQLSASYQPGFDLASQPGYGDAFNRIADISSRAYSAKAGNPAGNSTAQAGILSDVWNQGYLPALTNYRGQLGQFGGLGLNTAGTASLAGAGQTGGAYNALGYGLGSVTQPQNDIQSLLKQLGGNQNVSLNIGGMKYG